MNVLFCQLVFCIITGMKAETVHRYGLRGSKTCLPLPEPSQGLEWIKWTVNKTEIISKDRKVHAEFEEHFEHTEHSLCAKRLRIWDSGTYVVTADLGGKEQKITYKLTVEEAVGVPAMRMARLHFNSTPGWCRFSVNCSVGADWEVFVCDERGCAPSLRQMAPPTSVNITVSGGNRNVQCTGNNHVSTETDTQLTNDICAVGNSNTATAATSRLTLPLWLSGAAVFFLALLVGTVVVMKRWLSTRDSPPQERPEEDSVYSTVKAPVRAVVISVTPEPAQSSPDSEAASVYSTVQRKHAGSRPAGPSQRDTVMTCL